MIIFFTVVLLVIIRVIRISEIQWFVGRRPVVVEREKCNQLEAEMYSKINFEHLFKYHFWRLHFRDEKISLCVSKFGGFEDSIC